MIEEVRSARIPMRAYPSAKARWVAAAAKKGLSLREFIEQAVEASLERPAVDTRPGEGESGAPAPQPDEIIPAREIASGPGAGGSHVPGVDPPEGLSSDDQDSGVESVGDDGLNPESPDAAGTPEAPDTSQEEAVADSSAEPHAPPAESVAIGEADVQAQIATPVMPAPPGATSCPRQHHHRKGLYCRGCSTVPRTQG